MGVPDMGRQVVALTGKGNAAAIAGCDRANRPGQGGQGPDRHPDWTLTSRIGGQR